MRTMAIEWPWTKGKRADDAAVVRLNFWPMAALVAIVLLAGILRFYDLSALGYVNAYYTAGVKAMLQSWHNFFFVAAEPGGSVSLDKPPVGFWLQAASAAVFGVNAFGVLLPQLLAGMASVVLLYHLVQRRFGQLAGLVAALALAITPVVVATDRNNTIDSTLVLTLLLAAWAFIKATEGGKLKFLLLGAGLVGIGFNIKMLEAYLPLPAFYALYFLGAPDRLLRKIASVAIATVLLLVISLSWITIVDLTPAGQRPYVGSSGTNSAWNLAIGYNGVQRLLGMGRNSGNLLSILTGGSSNSGRGFGSRQASTGGFQPQGAPPQGGNFEPGQPPAGGFQAPQGGGFAQGGPQGAPPGGAQRGAFQPPDDGGGRGGFGGSPGGSPDGGAGGGMFGTGQPGPLRLFTGQMSNEISWLLPFGLFAGLLLAFRSRLRWPIAPKHQAVVLWGGWLLTGTVFFSVAGFFHPYYLVMLGAPLAALVGLGVAELWHMWQGREAGWQGAPWLALGLTLVAAGGTTMLQLSRATALAGTVWWLPVVAAIFGAGVVLLVLARREWPRVAAVGFACLVAAMLITPGIWSGLTTLYSTSSLPEAYAGRNRGGFGGPGGGPGAGVDQALLTYLEANTQGMKYLMAVPSSNQGAGYVIQTGRGVLYLGGFGGQDRVETAESMAALVANHELRYVYEGGGRGGPGAGQSDVSNWVASACKPVQYDTTAQGSATSGSNNRGNRGFGGGTLYDCQAG
jgi:4-amino-4-deoxy-L-arabinose transferase-like glycosyltransferase